MHWPQPLRAVLRTERLPTAALWLMAADGMALYLRLMARAVGDAVGCDRTQARQIVAEVMARMWRRRYAAMRDTFPMLPPATDAEIVTTMRGLYCAPGNRKTLWMYDALGGLPTDRRARLRSLRRTLALGPRACWNELATHLGDLLIVSTQSLGDLGVPRANQVIARMCHQSGVAYGELFKRRYRLPDTAEAAIEVLRIGEYIWQVNPEHESAADGQTGHIDGSACHWYQQSGWHPMHCGIFGQFQNGVSSVFGMRYSLTTTIPRHGGDRCRIDLIAIGEPRSAR